MKPHIKVVGRTSLDNRIWAAYYGGAHLVTETSLYYMSLWFKQCYQGPPQL